MSKTLKSYIALLLAFLMVFGALPLSGPASGSLFSLNAGALTSGLLTYTVSGGKATVTDCDVSADGTFSVPAWFGKYPVVEIGSYAFDACFRLTGVALPASVTKIGDYAFRGCSGLSAITIPDSVITLGSGCFTGCVNLRSAVLGEGIKIIPPAAFNTCSFLGNIVFPDNLEYVGEGALTSTPWYTEQPAGVVYAGNLAYTYKGTMPPDTSVELKSGTKAINAGCFMNSTQLVSINIPDSVVSIGSSAFYGCTGLKTGYRSGGCRFNR